MKTFDQTRVFWFAGKTMVNKRLILWKLFFTLPWCWNNTWEAEELQDFASFKLYKCFTKTRFYKSDEFGSKQSLHWIDNHTRSPYCKIERRVRISARIFSTSVFNVLWVARFIEQLWNSYHCLTYLELNYIRFLPPGNARIFFHFNENVTDERLYLFAKKRQTYNLLLSFFPELKSYRSSSQFNAATPPVREISLDCTEISHTHFPNNERASHSSMTRTARKLLNIL